MYNQTIILHNPLTLAIACGLNSFQWVINLTGHLGTAFNGSWADTRTHTRGNR